MYQIKLEMLETDIPGFYWVLTDEGNCTIFSFNDGKILFFEKGDVETLEELNEYGKMFIGPLPVPIPDEKIYTLI